MTTDFLRDCMQSTGVVGGSEQEFGQTFCRRCRNSDCVRAQWAADKFSARVQTQADRLFNPLQLDPRLPAFAHITEADFRDMLAEVTRLEVADRRGDWTIPEIPVLDGRPHVAPASGVEAALSALRKPNKEPDEPLDPDEEEVPPPEPPKPVLVAKPYPKEPIPAQGNTAAPRGGVFIGGAAPLKAAPKPAVDPRAVPETGLKKVLPGAVIRMDEDK